MLYEPLAEFYRENVQEQYRQGAMPGMTIEPELPKDLLTVQKHLQMWQLL